MQSVAEGVFAQNLPWSIVVVGMVIAVLVILLDLALEFRGSTFRTPVLAVAVGIYLPLELAVPILFGGLIAFAANRFHLRRIANEADGELKSSLREAQTNGTMSDGPRLDPREMFDDVYETLPPHLKKQRDEMLALEGL